MTGQGFSHRGKLFKLNIALVRQASELQPPSASGNRVITRILIMLFEIGGLLNCLFKVYVFMVCRTWWRLACLYWMAGGVGEEWVSVLDLYSFRMFYVVRCACDSGEVVRRGQRREMIHLIIVLKTSRTETDWRRRWARQTHTHSWKD